MKKLLIFGLLFLPASLLGEARAETDPIPIILSCSEQANPYYSIDMVTTRNVPGTGQATGKAIVSFKANPFGISITKDGSYQHQLDIQLEKVNTPKNGHLVAWITTPTLDKVKKIGALNKEMYVRGTSEWNKYIVVITLEEELSDRKKMWEGPIAFRGLSKSGFMHTMAGHGPFEQEPCAKFGYY